MYKRYETEAICDSFLYQQNLLSAFCRSVMPFFRKAVLLAEKMFPVPARQCRQSEIRQMVIALQFVSNTVVFIINVIVHFEILQYNIFAHMSQFLDYHLRL